jgi:hypothetical protein
VKYLGMCLAVIANREDESTPTLKDNVDWINTSKKEIIEKCLDIIASSKKDLLSEIDIPNGSCYIDKPFLENNIEFFLRYLKIANISNSGYIDCNRFIKHLNDCYRCFDIYCDIMREYLLEKEQLLRKINI